MTYVGGVARFVSRISSRFIDWTLKALSSSIKINNHLNRLEAKRLHKIGNPERILVVSDINIGDAIITQSFISPLKESYPETEISYAYQSKAYPLIRANPNIDRHFPLFKSIAYPSRRDCKSLKSIIEKNNFDLILNFCPYMSSNSFGPARTSVIHPIRLMANTIRSYASHNQKAQITLQMSQYAQELIKKSPFARQAKDTSKPDFSCFHLYLTQEPFTETKKLMKKLNIDPEVKKVFFNPDTASQYTLIPIDLQIKILKTILSNKNVDLLINCGYTFKGIEKELLKEIPQSLKKRVILIPREVPLDVFAVLTDHSDMFISGDTGPLHIAAAKKIMVDSSMQFRNLTSAIGIFGATSGKIYGYDSFSDEHIPTPQDAPSKIFEAFPSCKNLTCLDKIFKKCPKVRCFDGLKPEVVTDYIQNYLS